METSISICNEAIYEASGEQVQYWLTQTNNGRPKEGDQVLDLEFKIEDPDLDIVAKAVEGLLKRHESLRTFIKLIDGKVKQCVLPYSRDQFPLLYHDVSCDSDTGKATLKIKTEIADSLNDISVPPLFKCCIIEGPGRKYFISVLIHHAISDEWSRMLIYKELIYLYDCLKKGLDIKIDAGKMQLRDYANLQRKWLTENGRMAQLYWTSKLSKSNNGYLFERIANRIAFTSQLPVISTDQELTHILENTSTGNIIYQIEGSDFIQLRRFSECCNSSVFAVIYSSIQLLFFLLVGKKPILISTPFANRHMPGTETIIGWLVGTLYLNREIKEEMTVKEVINRGYIDFLEACSYPIYNHDDLRLSKELRYHTDIFINFTGKDFKMKKTLNSKGAELRYTEEKGSFFELVLLIGEFEDGLLCHWMNNTLLYPTETINYIITSYRKLLTTMFRNADMTVNELGKLTI